MTHLSKSLSGAASDFVDVNCVWTDRNLLRMCCRARPVATYCSFAKVWLSLFVGFIVGALTGAVAVSLVGNECIC